MMHAQALAVVSDHSIHEASRWAVIEEAMRRVPQTGALVEIGVHRGGATAYLALREPLREVYGFDTFEAGLSGASVIDGTFRDGMLGHPIADVIEWHASLGLTNVTLTKTDVRSGLPPAFPPIALALVDVDLYQPTRAALEWADRWLAPGGFVLVDDASFPGVAQAIAEYAVAFNRNVTARGYMAELR